MKDTYYIKYTQMIGRGFCSNPRWSNVWFRNNLYCAPIYFPACDDRVEISKTPHHSLIQGYTYENPKYNKHIGDNLYGEKEELENWKYNVYNNKIFPFISMCLISNQNNCSKNYLPWITDKKYTDYEIYKLLNLTEEEIQLIEKTINKYQKTNDWFRRFMYGKHFKDYIKEKYYY